MRKLIITCSIILSGFAFAQSTDNPYIYDDEPSAEEQDVFPSNPGDPNPSPVDQYIPLLLLTAIGMVVVFARNKKTV